MGNALGKSLAGTVDAGNNAAKELVRCENLKNTIFYEHTFSMKLPYRVGQVSLFGGIILLVVAIIFTNQHSKKDEKDEKDSSAFAENKGWWISSGVLVGLGIVLIVYALTFLRWKFSNKHVNCAAKLATANLVARDIGSRYVF